jgi:PAS domain S-box-containing protein
MVWTNPIFHLMWLDIRLDTSYSPPVDAVIHNVGFWIQAGYSYLLILLGTVALLTVYLRSTGIYRKQVGAMLLASLVPWVANFLYIAHIEPFTDIDPTPLAFAVSGAALFWGLFRLQLLDIMPVAHEAVFRNMTDGVIVVDARGRITELNPAAQAIIGRSRSEIVGQSYRHNVPEQIGSLELTAESSELPSVVALGEGPRVRHYRIEVSRITTRGQFRGHLVLLHDDTGRIKTEAETRERVRLEAELIERLRAEQTLRVSESKFRNLVENAATGIVVSSRDGRILSANRAALRDFGYESEDDIGETPAAELFVNPDDAQRLAGPMENKGIARGFDVRMKRKDGGSFWASLSVISQVGESGEWQYLAMVDDVTDRKQAENELAKSREELRLLAQRVEQAREEERTSIARELHDQVGQTFTALKLDIRRLRRSPGAESPEVLALLDGMDSMVSTGADDVRRISSELRPGALDDLGLAGAIDWQLDQIRSRTDIAFTLSHSEEVSGLDSARSTALFRIFQELITNVVRHAGATKVDVSLRHENGELVLDVVDDGCGMDTDKIDDRHSLGIVGMKERLLPYGGKLHIEGVAGKGTSVRVTMPQP